MESGLDPPSECSCPSAPPQQEPSGDQQQTDACQDSRVHGFEVEECHCKSRMALPEYGTLGGGCEWPGAPQKIVTWIVTQLVEKDGVGGSATRLDGDRKVSRDARK